MKEKEIVIGSTLEVPIEQLKESNYKELLNSLIVPNPEAKNKAFFGSKFAQNSVPDKLCFFDTNKAKNTIILPRNIDFTYIKNPENINFEKLARGIEIVDGLNENFKLRDYQEEFFNSKVFPQIWKKISRVAVVNLIYNNNIYNNIINNINKNYINNDVLLNCPCGSGKTIMSLYLANIYRRSTIVAVTKKALGNQFIATIKSLFPNWSVGWEDGKNKYDVTIATYSLLSDKKYNEDYFSQFGHIIMDEYHRAGAGTYQTILSKANCQYRTTLTATFRRKDGLHKILAYHIGEVLEMQSINRTAKIYPILTQMGLNENDFRNAERNQIKILSDEELRLPFSKRSNLTRLTEYQEVSVKDNKTRREVGRGRVVSIDYTTPRTVKISSPADGKVYSFNSDEVTFHKLGTISVSSIDTSIIDNAYRNDIVLKLLKQCRREGRKVIILSKRKEQLYKLYYRLKRYGYKVGVVISEKASDYISFCKSIGKSVIENREYTLKEAEVVLGIDKLAEEGLDIPHIDTIIYLHPIKDIEQSIGRVTRELPNKPNSQAFYLVDDIRPYKKAWEGKDGAKEMFKRLGHEVEAEQTIEEFIKF